LELPVGIQVLLYKEREYLKMEAQSSWTVAELRKYLNHFNDDTFVYFGIDKNDRWKTTIAIPITKIEKSKVEFCDVEDINIVSVFENEEESIDAIIIS